MAMTVAPTVTIFATNCSAHLLLPFFVALKFNAFGSSIFLDFSFRLSPVDLLFMLTLEEFTTPHTIQSFILSGDTTIELL
jgi:hypothetical protein